MNITTRVVPRLAALAATLALLAGCGSTTAGQHPAAHHSTTAVAAVTGITCTDIDADLVTVLSDLKTMDKHLQEAWVSGGDSNDLQHLISDTQDADPNGQPDQCGRSHVQPGRLHLPQRQLALPGAGLAVGLRAGD
jgi:hypothetical protein